jgi:hypothetical protein
VGARPWSSLPNLEMRATTFAFSDYHEPPPSVQPGLQREGGRAMGTGFLYSEGCLYVNSPARRGDICWRKRCWSRSGARVVEQLRTWRRASAVLGGVPRSASPACSHLPSRAIILPVVARPREHRAAPRRDGGARADSSGDDGPGGGDPPPPPSGGVRVLERGRQP